MHNHDVRRVVQDADFLLHAWLAETDQGRAAQRFSQYFRVAFPAVCRFLRSLRADEATAQDVSQQALIKLFTHLGTKRREADSRIRAALSGLQPLDFGPLHSKRVHSWREQVGRFRAAAVAFRISEVQPSDEAWRQAREAINSCAAPLARQGRHFLIEVRLMVESTLSRLLALQGEVASESQRPSAESAGVAADILEAEAAAFAARLLLYSAGRDDDSVDAAIGCPGAARFVSRTNTVCDDLPAVAIPSNGLLYTIAKRQFLNSMRSSASSQLTLAAAAADESETQSVLEEWQMDSSMPDDFQRPIQEMTSSTAPDPASDLDDDNRDIESRYQAFLEFLRAPLSQAEAALAEAESAGSARAQRAKVDTLRRKYERMSAVLRSLHESPQPSEDEIAHKHGLTRNQIKYVIERVREDFNHFFPELTRAAQGRRKRKGVET
jgi:DNA-directed RNA polymerase specialized sigma24 family protein